MERGERATDVECGRGLVATDRPAFANDPIIETSADGFVKEADGFEVGGSVVHGLQSKANIR